MSRVRVLRLIARLNVGGPAIHATLLTEHLRPDRYDTVLVTGSVGASEGDYLKLFGSPGSRIVEIPQLGREISLRRDWTVYRQLRSLIAEFQPDIVHTHTAKAGLLGRLAARRAGVPVIVHTFHGHVLRGYFSIPVEWVFAQVERVLARMSTRLLAVSQQVRDELLARGIGTPDRFDVVPLGFDLSRFAAAATRRGELRKELGLTASVPLVGIVARLVPIKAHDIFLRMAVSVLRARPDTVFLVVGDGECRAALEAAAGALGIAGQVRFLGWRSDLDVVYSDLDVVVLTSRNEGSPVAIIEAMASARPVVATAVGGVPELLGTDGIVVEVDDVEGLAAGVLQVIADPARFTRTSAIAQTRIASQFSRERLLQDIDTLYERLLQERRRR